MIGDINQITLCGILEEYPIERMSKDGTKTFCTMRLEVKNRYKKDADDVKSVFPIVCFDSEKARIFCANLKKGDLLFITGSVTYQKKPKSDREMYMQVVHTSNHFFKPLKEIDYNAVPKRVDEFPDDDLPF